MSLTVNGFSFGGFEVLIGKISDIFGNEIMYRYLMQFYYYYQIYIYIRAQYLYTYF